MKVGVTTTYYNKKCVNYATTYNDKLMSTNKADSAVLKEKNIAASVEKELTDEAPNGQPSDKVIAPGHPNELSPGFRFPFDNFDIRQNVRDMTEDNQNKDIHWVNHNAVQNRESGNHLCNNLPICDINDRDNVKLLPSSTDHILQRENYITLVGRVITQEIPYLKFCQDSFPQHIQHLHSKEMSRKSEKV